MTPEIKLNGVYYVESSSSEHPYNPLAIRPKFIKARGQQEERRCEWEDTGRGGYLFYQKVVPSSLESENPQLLPREFTLIAKDGALVKFVLLTTDLFKQKVNAYGNLEFNNDKDLQDYYLKKEFTYL